MAEPEKMSSEELREIFSTFIEGIIAMGQPYNCKIEDIREAAANFVIPITEVEIVALLEPSERKRKAEWEKMLRRFSKSP